MTEEYCAKCGIELPDETTRVFKSILFKDLPKAWKIDGKKYCEKCAKAIVEKRRKEE